MPDSLTSFEAAAFELDGSLRGICVLETDLAAWRTTLDHVLSKYRTAFRLNGDVASIPSVEVLLSRSRDDNLLLSVDVGGPRANCHFVDEGTIEFDIDPREIRDRGAVAAVLGFLSGVGRALGRRVFLTAGYSHSVDGLPEPPDGEMLQGTYYEYHPARDTVVEVPLGAP